MSTNRSTLTDVASIKDPNGRYAMIAEVLNRVNEIIQDAPTFPSNAPLGNRVTKRINLTSPQFTKVNKGTPVARHTTAQRTDSMGIIDFRSEVPSKLKAVLGSGAFDAERMQQNDATLESYSQFVAEMAFYGDEATNEAAFTGFAPRLETLNEGDDKSASQVWDMGGADNLASMYIVDWSKQYVHFIHPMDGVAGLQAEDKGEIDVDDEDGNAMFAFVMAYLWGIGLTVKYDNHIARIANIDIEDANLGASAGDGQLSDTLIDVMTEMPSPGGAQRVIYCPSRIEAAFYKQALSKTNAALSVRDYLNKPTAFFWNYPIRRCDALSVDEDQVT